MQKRRSIPLGAYVRTDIDIRGGIRAVVSFFGRLLYQGIIGALLMVVRGIIFVALSPFYAMTKTEVHCVRGTGRFAPEKEVYMRTITVALIAARATPLSCLLALVGPVSLLFWYYQSGFVFIPVDSMRNLALHIGAGFLFSFGAVGYVRELRACFGLPLRAEELRGIVVAACLGAVAWEIIESLAWTPLMLKSMFDVFESLIGAALGLWAERLWYRMVLVPLLG